MCQNTVIGFGFGGALLLFRANFTVRGGATFINNTAGLHMIITGYVIVFIGNILIVNSTATEYARAIYTAHEVTLNVIAILSFSIPLNKVSS